MKDFKLGKPALVCRWRLFNGELPLQNRHLRALSMRAIAGQKVSPPLVAWVKQHLEWGLQTASSEHPDGVLMLVVDEEGASALSLGPYLELKKRTANDLLRRAREAREEALKTGVAPEELWVCRGDCLVRSSSSEFASSGSSSLVVDLAHTMGMPVKRDEDLLQKMSSKGLGDLGEEAFLVSDEHGVVPASDRGGQRGQKFAQSYQKLLTRNWRRPR